jgi:exopolyphosphatase/guanosine-5'-triphosphate,3'-diphosphate pyrophosphatase
VGKLPKLQPLARQREQWLAVLCLRLAVLLLRRREDVPPLPLNVSVKGNSIVVSANGAWLAGHPLSGYTLRAEESEWRKVGFEFELIEK